MTNKIPQAFLDDLIARTDIVEIIQARIKLQKKGQNYTGLCPFHNEKTPSFSVSAQKQFYYCFGCGAHGNAIGFLMAFDRMEFIDAINDLSARLGVDVPTETTQQPNNHKIGFELLEKANHFYQQALRQAPVAIEYLKSRGLTGKIAKQFCIGYAPNEWENLIKFCDQTNELITFGLAINKDSGKTYDRFRNRIMFPIRDYRGRTIAFGGRALGDDTPKYINSPETPLFHKSAELYGLYETLQQNRHPQSILVVEGYMDVIALHQLGITTAVAALGTATNPKHLQKLFRYTHQVIFCFDGDNAGRQAAWKALTNNLALLHDGVQVRFMFLPEGDDPDSLIRRVGVEGFKQRLEKAQPISEVFFELIEQIIPLDTPENKARYAKEANRYLNQIPQGIFHNLMLERLAKKLNLFVSDLDKPKTQPQLNKANKRLLTNVEKAIALLLQEPKLSGQISLDRLESCADTSLLRRLIAAFKQDPNKSIGEIIEHFQDETDKATIAQLAARRLPFEPEAMMAEFEGAINRIYTQQDMLETKQLIEKSKNNQLSDQERVKLNNLLTKRHNQCIRD